MDAFDARHIQETCGIADQNAAFKREFRQALQTAFNQRTRTISDTAAAFKGFADFRMGFETLELFKRRQIRVLIIQTDHKADSDFVFVKVINKRAAVGFAVERPACAVHDQTGLMFFRRHFPNFFNAQAVSLRLAVLVELKLFNDLFGKRAATAFGKYGLLRPKLHAGLE